MCYRYTQTQLITAYLEQQQPREGFVQVKGWSSAHFMNYAQQPHTLKYYIQGMYAPGQSEKFTKVKVVLFGTKKNYKRSPVNYYKLVVVAPHAETIKVNYSDESVIVS